MYMNNLELEQIEFDELERDQQHERLIEVLMQFIESSKNSNSEGRIVSAVAANSEKIAHALKTMKLEAPKVEMNQGEVVRVMNKVLDSVDKTNELLTELIYTNRADREFKMNYDALHKIKSIIVSLKP